MNSWNTRRVLQEALIPILNLAVITGLTVFIINRDLPRVGHDYRIHLPRMLDTYLFNRLNGLGIQWYTPSFGGGLPAYPNPLNIQYSLPQFLVFIMNPWRSLMLSFAIFSTVGFFSFYFLLREELGLIKNASILGAASILANGFFIEHAIVGHIGYQPFPLLGLILFLIFSKRIGRLQAGILLGIITALLINQAGFYLLIIFLLSLAVMLPLLYLVKPELYDWRRLVAVASGGILFSIALSASKLNAIFSYMRFFPRIAGDMYGTTYLQGIAGMATQLLGCFVVIPYFLLTGKNLGDLSDFFQHATGATDYKVWETDLSISPAILLLLIAGMIMLISLVRNGRVRFSKDKAIAAIVLLFGLWLIADLALAQGWLYNSIKSLPVIRSLHVNVRFAAALIFPLSFLGAYVFHALCKDRRTASLLAFIFLDALAILTPLLYLTLQPSIHLRNFNVKWSLRMYSQIGLGNIYPVTKISDMGDEFVLSNGSSNLYRTDEAIFGYYREQYTPKVHEGSIFQISDGYFNMTNPASYVFPAENNISPYERFRADQLAELDRFVNRKPFDSKISASQHVANILSLAALICLAIYAVVQSGFHLARTFSGLQRRIGQYSNMSLK